MSWGLFKSTSVPVLLLLNHVERQSFRNDQQDPFEIELLSSAETSPSHVVLIAQWRREMHVYSAFPYKQMVQFLSKGNQTNVRTRNARSTQVTLVVRYASLNLCTWSSPLQPLHTPCQALPKLAIGLLMFREDFGALLVDSDKCAIQFGKLIQRPL